MTIQMLSENSQEENQNNSSLTAPAPGTISLIVDSLPTILNLGKTLLPKNDYQVMISLENHTSFGIEPHNYFEPHGKIGNVAGLPVISPSFQGDAHDHYVCTESFFVCGRDHASQAPAVLMQWKIHCKREVYLMAFIYAAGALSDHYGFFGLYDKPVDLKKYWSEAKKDKDYYVAGQVGSHCNQNKFGFQTNGSLTNLDPGTFSIAISET